MSDKISRVLDLEKTNPNSVVINDETGTMSDVDISFSSENDWQNANDDVNRKIPTQASVKKFFKDMSSYVHKSDSHIKDMDNKSFYGQISISNCS